MAAGSLLTVPWGGLRQGWVRLGASAPFTHTRTLIIEAGSKFQTIYQPSVGHNIFSCETVPLLNTCSGALLLHEPAAHRDAHLLFREIG
jgi:hypothetical protein